MTKPAVGGARRAGGALAPEPEAEVLSIAQLYRRVDDALASAFSPRVALWVRGEVQTLSDRTGHCYMDLIDPDSVGDRQAPVLKVRCWRQTWGPLRASLARAGIELVPGTVVHLVGRIDFYRARAEVNFVMAGLDPANCAMAIGRSDHHLFRWSRTATCNASAAESPGQHPRARTKER